MQSSPHEQLDHLNHFEVVKSQEISNKPFFHGNNFLLAKTENPVLLGNIVELTAPTIRAVFA